MFVSGLGNLNILYFVSKLQPTNLKHGKFWSFARLSNQALSELLKEEERRVYYMVPTFQNDYT